MPTRCASFSLLVLLLAVFPGRSEASLTVAEQRCVVALNSDLGKLGKDVRREVVACIKDHNDGDLTDIASCVAEDRRGRIARSQARTVGDDADLCVFPPAVFYTGAAVVNQAGVDTGAGLLSALYGDDVEAAALDDATDPSGARCQETVANRLKQCQDQQFREFERCKKSALATGKEPFPAGADSGLELEACLLDDPKGRIAKVCDRGQVGDGKVDRIRKELDKRCLDEGVDLAVAFAHCDEDDPDAIHGCLDRGARCATCEAVNAADALTANCDRLDNGVEDLTCSPGLEIVQETIDLPSGAQPPETPGSPGVDASAYPKLVTQFGGTGFDLNKARYTRYRLDLTPAPQPDSILVLVPGFEGGAGSFTILAENVIRRAWKEKGLALEVWAFDRRSNLLEDLVGLDIAEAEEDAEIALDWLYGGELGLSLHPDLVAGPNRRAVFHGTQADTAFIANWTANVHARDIDAVVSAARAAAKNANVFLGGHSAGTGFAARYAATDFDVTGLGPVDAGYAKLRGLVFLEGGGGSTAGTPPSEDTLDRIEDRFDGGLFHAVRDGAPRCIDGTPCTEATEALDCAGKGNETCTPSRTSYSVLAGLLNPRVLASVEVAALQGVKDPDEGQLLLQADQGAIGNNAIAVVPDLGTLALLQPATVLGGLGQFIDDDGFIAGFVSFVATSVGLAGPVEDGLLRWQTISESVPAGAFVDNGPAPTTLPAGVWGVEAEPTSVQRMLQVFFGGGTNFTDWYYPSSGLAVTSGLPSLDSSALSVGRGRRDIENLTQAANIDIPVIALGGTNGLSSVPGDFVAFAQSIGTCSAGACDGATPRVVDPTLPSEAFPTVGGIVGGFEIYMSEGYSHVDIVTAEDQDGNEAIGPIVDFIERHTS